MDQPEMGKPEDEIKNEGAEEVQAEAEAVVEEVTAEVPETSEVEAVVEEVTAEVETSAEEASSEAEAVVEEASAEVVAETKEKKPAKKSRKRPPRPAVVNDTGLERGQLIEGKITETAPTAITVNLGERDGIVPGRELEMMSRKMLETLQVDETIMVYVVNPKNHRGETVLSINHAMEEMDWRRAYELFESKEAHEGKISGYNKGGLIVRFGRLRAFVPQSQISEQRLRLMQGETPEERYGKLVNEPVHVKVMEVDRKRNRLIFSERAAVREIRQAQKEQLIQELTQGEEREGTVVSLENFGAFVDIGGAEGLIHLTEISWSHITHPRQALSIGEQVRVKVISIDPNGKRIGLSMKAAQEDPWDVVASAFVPGQLVQGTVTKLSNFGAFAQIDGASSVEGLVHISELADTRVEHPRDVVKKGDQMTLRVVKVDIKNRRLGLSLKRVKSSEYLDQDMAMAFQDDDAAE